MDLTLILLITGPSLLPIGLIGVSMSFPANGDVYMRGGIVSIEFPLFYCSLYDLVCGQAE